LTTSLKIIDRQLIRFAAIGGVGLFVDMAALWVALQLIGLNLYTGRLFSFLVTATFTWACNRALTFAGSGTHRVLHQWARFIGFNAIGGIVNFAVYVMVAVKLRESFLWPAQIASVLPYIGVACGSVCGLVFNFMTSKFFVFR
jgi:putative flippase GtrA